MPDMADGLRPWQRFYRFLWRFLGPAQTGLPPYATAEEREKYSPAQPAEAGGRERAPPGYRLHGLHGSERRARTGADPDRPAAPGEAPAAPAEAPAAPGSRRRPRRPEARRNRRTAARRPDLNPGLTPARLPASPASRRPSRVGQRRTRQRREHEHSDAAEQREV